MASEPKHPCRTPAEGRDGATNVPVWKFEVVRDAILNAVTAASADGIAFEEVREAVRDRLSPETLAKLGSLGWHITTIKLEMEVARDVRRMAAKSPQRLVLA
ncbi:MAG: hypothetical protein AAFQ35_01575 [Pseudomonadota bacterium]